MFSYEILTLPPFSTMYLIFGIEHLLCATCFTHITFLLRELALCGCGWPSSNPTPSYGPSGLALLQRSIGSRSCGEGSGSCSSRQAGPPGRRPGDLGARGRPRGATAAFVAPRDCAPAGQTGRRAERRGSEGRGARGGPEEGRWHRLLRLRAPRRSRSESRERLAEARSAQSGSEVRSLGPRCRRRPRPTRVQPGSSRRRAGRRWSSLEPEPAGEAGAPSGARAGAQAAQALPTARSSSQEAPSVPRSLPGAPRR